MKKLIFLTVLAVFSCQKPEFYIDGKPYYTKERCVEKTLIWEYHYGYNPHNFGKLEMHYGENEVCIKIVVDTIELR